MSQGGCGKELASWKEELPHLRYRVCPPQPFLRRIRPETLIAKSKLDHRIRADPTQYVSPVRWWLSGVMLTMLSPSKPRERTTNSPSQVRRTGRRRGAYPSIPSSHRPIPNQIGGTNGVDPYRSARSFPGKNVATIGMTARNAGRFNTIAIFSAHDNGLGSDGSHPMAPFS
jgi:hypothetical protein